MRLILALLLVTASLSFSGTPRGEPALRDRRPPGRPGGGFGVRSPRVKPERGARPLAMRRTWFDGQREHSVFVNPERVLVFAADAGHTRHAPRSGAQVVSRQPGMAVWSVPSLEEADLPSLDRGRHTGARVCVCVHAGPDTSSQPLGLPGGLFVRAAEGVDLTHLMATIESRGYGEARVTAYDARLIYVETVPGLGVLDLVTELGRLEAVAEAQPNWWRGDRR